MQQLTLATIGFDKHSKQTRRAAFLGEMEQVVPWRELCAVVEPYYPKPGNGRRAIDWNECCDCTFCSTGSTCLIRRLRRRCMIRFPCAISSALILGVSGCRTRRQSSTSVIYWNAMT